MRYSTVRSVLSLSALVETHMHTMAFVLFVVGGLGVACDSATEPESVVGTYVLRSVSPKPTVRVGLGRPTTARSRPTGRFRLVRYARRCSCGTLNATRSSGT